MATVLYLNQKNTFDCVKHYYLELNCVLITAIKMVFQKLLNLLKDQGGPI